MEVESPAIHSVIETFDEARASGGGPYKNTVGYGEKYPQYTGSNLVVKMNNSATGIHFPDQTHERGYDQTYFGSETNGAARFIEFLVEAGLEPKADFLRIYRDLGRGCDGDYPAYWLYVWVNNELLVSTTCNPINGDPASRTVSASPGYAGCIGISGKKEAVSTASSTIEDIADIKERRDDGLFF